MNPEVVQTVWKSHLDIANKHYEPGVFTTLIASEWTSPPSNQNLYRNVFFRDDEGPDVPFSAFDRGGTVEIKPSDPTALSNRK